MREQIDDLVRLLERSRDKVNDLSVEADGNGDGEVSELLDLAFTEIGDGADTLRLAMEALDG